MLWNFSRSQKQVRFSVSNCRIRRHLHETGVSSKCRIRNFSDSLWFLPYVGFNEFTKSRLYLIFQIGHKEMSAQRGEGRDGLEIKEVWRPQFPAIFSSPYSHSEGLVYIWFRCKLNVFQNTVCYRKYTAMRKCAFYVESPRTEETKHRKSLIAG